MVVLSLENALSAGWRKGETLTQQAYVTLITSFQPCAAGVSYYAEIPGFVAQYRFAESVKLALLVVVAGDRSQFLTPFHWGWVVLSLSATKTPDKLSAAR